MQVVYKDLGATNEVFASIIRPGRVHIVHENGDTFDGSLIQNNSTGEYQPHGYGKYVWKSPTSNKRVSTRYFLCYYEGEYDHGQKHGLGCYSYSNGSVYRGNWLQGQKHGAGTITYSNGDKFAGMFFEDKKHGKGCYTYAVGGGTQLMGEWSHGRVVNAKWVFPSGKAAPTTEAIEKIIGVSPPSTPPANGTVFGVVIAGAPASGKGTQCERIREEFGLVHLSTGDMLRAAVAAQSPIGLQAKSVMERGGLVGDDLVIGAIRERLAQPDVQEHGFLLDGFPRTAAQALALKQLGFPVHAFILLQVPDEFILERVTGRRVDPVTGNSYHVKFNPPHTEDVMQRLVQRKDDTEECVKPRLENFHVNIANIREHFSDCEICVDGTCAPGKVWEQIETQLQDVFEEAHMRVVAKRSNT